MTWIAIPAAALALSALYATRQGGSFKELAQHLFAVACFSFVFLAVLYWVS